MTDPRPRYKIYQSMLDAMVNIIDSIRLTASEDMIEQDMVTIRRQIRSANYTLDNMVTQANEGWSFEPKKEEVKPNLKLGSICRKDETITKQTDILKRYDVYIQTLDKIKDELDNIRSTSGEIALNMCIYDTLYNLNEAKKTADLIAKNVTESREIRARDKK